MTPDQLPPGCARVRSTGDCGMDDKIEAWRHGLLRLVLQHARAYADNSDPAKTEAAYVAIPGLPPHNARRLLRWCQSNGRTNSKPAQRKPTLYAEQQKQPCRRYSGSSPHKRQKVCAGATE